MGDDTPRVLILLAAFNGAQWIEDQLQSVLGQSAVEVHVLVSDDCSSDGTLQIVNGISASDARVTCISRASASGSSAANFLGLLRDADLRGFSHVAFCDQDDLWLQDKLSTACMRLAQERSDLYSAATTAFWPSGRKIVLRQSRRQTPSDFLFEGAGQGCTFVLTAALGERIRSFVNDNPVLVSGVKYHDWLCYALARSWGLRWAYDDVPQLLYRQHRANDTGARNKPVGWMRRFALIRSGWYRAQIEVMAAICLRADPAMTSVRHVLLLSSRSRTSVRDRIAWCLYVSRWSRRRQSDRIVMLACALLGYL